MDGASQGSNGTFFFCINAIVSTISGSSTKNKENPTNGSWCPQGVYSLQGLLFHSPGGTGVGGLYSHAKYSNQTHSILRPMIQKNNQAYVDHVSLVSLLKHLNY